MALAAAGATTGQALYSPYAALAAAAGQSPQYVNMAILASLHSSQSSVTLWDWLDTGAVREAAAQASGQSQSGPTGGTESHRQTQTGGGGSFGGGSCGSGAPPLGTGGTCEGGESFAADTLVATPSGERPISSLRVGDPVEAYDPATGSKSVQTVRHVFIDHDSDRLDATLATTANSARVTSQGDQASHSARLVPVGTLKVFARDDQQANAQTTPASGLVREVVHTTARHPWLTADQVWVRAGTLALGERVVRADGSTAIVVGLRAVAGAGDMWDLTVSTVHTFLVGAGQFVVHNCPPPPGGSGGRPPTHNVHGGNATPDIVLGNAIQWLGVGYREIYPGVFRSADGLRQFRMTASDLLASSPHVHFEAIGPDLRWIIENSHVSLI